MRYLIPALALLGGVGCATTTTSSGVAFEELEFNTTRTDDFAPSKYSTYKVVGFGAIDDPSGSWAKPDIDIAEELRYQVHRVLHARGWRPVADKPDVVIVVVLAIDATQIWELRSYSPDLDVPFAAGGLLLQLRSGETGAPLFAAGVSGPIRTDQAQWSDEKARQRMAYAVETALARMDDK